MNWIDAVQHMKHGSIFKNDILGCQYRIVEDRLEAKLPGGDEWTPCAISGAEQRANWIKAEQWKEVKWWEAANVLSVFPDENYVKCYTENHGWVTAKPDMLNEFTVKEFSEIRFSMRDFEAEAK